MESSMIAPRGPADAESLGVAPRPMAAVLADRAAAMDRLLRQAAPHGGAAAERVKATRP
jgi:hypothetical protein